MKKHLALAIMAVNILFTRNILSEESEKQKCLTKAIHHFMTPRYPDFMEICYFAEERSLQNDIAIFQLCCLSMPAEILNPENIASVIKKDYNYTFRKQDRNIQKRIDILKGMFHLSNDLLCQKDH